MVAFLLFVVAQNQAGVFKVQQFESSKIIENHGRNLYGKILILA